MNKKQTYAAPTVDEIILFPREAVLNEVSTLTLIATMPGGDSTPAVESADFFDNQSW